jgi:hypothetical protein
MRMNPSKRELINDPNQTGIQSFFPCNKSPHKPYTTSPSANLPLSLPATTVLPDIEKGKPSVGC